MAHTVIPPPRCTAATLELTHKGNINDKTITERDIEVKDFNVTLLASAITRGRHLVHHRTDTFTHVYTYKYMHTYIYIYTHTYTHPHIYIYIYTHTHMHAYTCIHIHMYTHTHT